MHLNSFPTWQYSRRKFHQAYTIEHWFSDSQSTKPVLEGKIEICVLVGRATRVRFNSNTFIKFFMRLSSKKQSAYSEEKKSFGIFFLNRIVYLISGRFLWSLHSFIVCSLFFYCKYHNTNCIHICVYCYAVFVSLCSYNLSTFFWKRLVIWNFVYLNIPSHLFGLSMLHCISICTCNVQHTKKALMNF